jgi:hypothetical protein
MVIGKLAATRIEDDCVAANGFGSHRHSRVERLSVSGDVFRNPISRRDHAGVGHRQHVLFVGVIGVHVARVARERRPVPHLLPIDGVASGVHPLVRFFGRRREAKKISLVTMLARCLPHSAKDGIAIDHGNDGAGLQDVTYRPQSDCDWIRRYTTAEGRDIFGEWLANLADLKAHLGLFRLSRISRISCPASPYCCLHQERIVRARDSAMLAT